MEFRETLLAAQRNQQQKSSESLYYKARFDPPKKEQKQRDKLSANIKKFLAKKDEEEKQKKIETQKKRDDLLAMRDPKALRKIQKTLKTIKSANKSVLEDAVDRDNTALTLSGPDQPDQDDYGYESQEAAAIYAKMMQKYSKIPDEPKFSSSNLSVKKDLKGTMERVKHALQHEDDPVPHKRRRRTENDKEDSPTRYEPEKERKEEKKPDKPKIRKPMPPPMDFNQLLKLAEQKKSEPVGPAVQKKQASESKSENERPMTKKQRREYEEEMARRQRRQERLDADKNPKRPQKERDEKPPERERAEQRPSGFGRIPKLNDKNSDRNNSPRPNNNNNDKDNRPDRDRSDRDKADKMQRERDRVRQERERLEREKERVDREKDKIDRERLERLKAERERIDRELERLSKDKDRLDKTKTKIENGKGADRSKTNSSDSMKKSIDLKSQNTYRIDKNSNERKIKDERLTNGQRSQDKVTKTKEQMLKNVVRDKAPLVKQRTDAKPENGKRLPDNKPAVRKPDDRPGRPQAGPSQNKSANSFDFDKHVNSLKKDVGGKNGARPPGDGKRRPHPDDPKRKQGRRVVDSESDYDSEMDDFIDDGEENMDYSKHIKEIFGYDKSKYRDMDDDDDPMMESSFARQQREEFISKKIGIMEDLEDMRLEALEKKKTKKKRRISDD